jgi:hypothetical protein
VRRLTLVAVAEIETILRAQRDVDLLVGVPIQVAEVERERPVAIALPTLKRGAYILTSAVLGSARILDLSMQASAACGQEKKRCANARSVQMLTKPAFHFHRELVYVGCVAFRASTSFL